MYSIDDGESNMITGGLQACEVWRVAQEIADERGESVWVYSDDDEDYIEVMPEA